MADCGFPPPEAGWTRARADSLVRRWREIFGTAHSKDYCRGVKIVRQGEGARAVLFIESGLVKTVCILPNGVETLLILRLPGGFVDHSAHALAVPYLGSALAVTDCRIHSVEPHLFYERLSTRHGVEFLTEISGAALVAFGVAAIEGKLMTAERRFARLLIQIAEATGSMHSRGAIDLHGLLKDYELAEYLGISASNFSKLRKRLIDRGVIGCEDHSRLFIPDVTSLLALAAP